MSKDEILEKYFLEEIEAKKNQDFSGWWIVGRVEGGLVTTMDNLVMLKADNTAWLYDFTLALMGNGFVLSNRECSLCKDDILEAMTELYPQVNTNVYLNTKLLEEIMNNPDTFKVKPDTSYEYWWNTNMNNWNGASPALYYDTTTTNHVENTSAKVTDAVYTCSASDCAASADNTITSYKADSLLNALSTCYSSAAQSLNSVASALC